MSRRLKGLMLLLAAVVMGTALPSRAVTNITSNVTLAEDADWRDQGKVTIAVGVTVDLNGYNLKVKGLECNGSIIDSSVPEYRQLSYIQSFGTQWINTGFTTTENTAIDFDFTVLTDNGNKAYFAGDWANNGHLFVINRSNIKFFGGIGTTVGSYKANKHLRFQTIPGGLCTMVLRDGDTLGVLGSSAVALTRQGSGETTIFAADANGSYASSYRLHRFTLTHEGTVVRDFVPAKRTSDDAVGLYDLANSQFYENAGSGEFGEGDAVVCGSLVPDGRLCVDVSDGASYSISGSCNVPAVVIDSVLADDCDLRCFGRNLTVAGTVNLAGRRMTVAEMSGDGIVVAESKPYRYYRFTVDATGGEALQISKVCLFNGESDITSNRANVLWDETNFRAKFLRDYNPTKALDGSTGTKWYDDRATAGNANADRVWVTLEYSEPVRVTRYQWYTADDTATFPGRSPTAWHLQASDDNAEWVCLDMATNMSVTSSNKSLAYDKTIADASLPFGGELRVDVAAGTTVVNCDLAVTGGVRLVKSGSGVFVAAKTGQGYAGGTVVDGGYMKPGKNSTGLFGAAGTPFAVSDGAQYLDDIWAPNASVDHHLAIAGVGPDGNGALRTTVSGKNDNSSYGWMRSLALAGDALIRRDAYAFSLMAAGYECLPLALNGHTLTFQSATVGNVVAQDHPHLLVSSVTSIGEGTMVVGDNICLYPYRNNASVFSNATIVVSEGGKYYTDKDTNARDLTVSNFVYRSGSTASQVKHTTTVLGAYTPASAASAPKVVLGDATHLSTTLDLSAHADTFDADFGGGLTFAAGTTVSVKIGDRKVPRKVIGWADGTGPSNVRFVLADAEGRLEVKTDGVYRASGLVVVIL